ncbi:MAG: PIN domain-containing protein [Anaerolineae bacterium]|nr:PIN domain-containing protein [Anaerolineae bacterium]
MLILDTNILWNIDLCRRLSDRVTAGELQVFIPTLVHAERIRQIAEQYGEDFAIDVVRQFIADARFDLLPLTTEHAEELGDVWLQLQVTGCDEAYWHKHRFDIVICAIARSSGYTLVTDETGSHFDLLSDRINMTELQTVLGETQD